MPDKIISLVVPVAQWIERLPSKQRVVGSNPTRDARIQVKRSLIYEVPRACPWVSTLQLDSLWGDRPGTDRALKRLSRISIKDVVKPSPSVSIDTPMAEISSVCKQRRWVWVVDDDRRLIGWIDRAILPETSSVKEAVVRGNPDEIAVVNSSTLRETLSRMLGQGLKSIPVVDDGNHLVGEVALSDIEAATAETTGTGYA